MSLIKVKGSSIDGALAAVDGSALTGISAETNSPYFDIKLGSDATSKNNNTWYYLGYSAGFGTGVNENVGSGWDNSQGYFQAPQAGRYYFYIKQGCYGTTTHSGYDIAFSKLQKASAGSTSFSDISGYPSCRSGCRPAGQGYCGDTTQYIINLASGERIIFGVHVYAGGSQTDWRWDRDDTRWGGMFLGA